ncbi:hypothetical protein FB567DRAFT_446817 [Paraphoma chrysanthemicola]|uniref:Uncharacterized protein n=1 Tax=Paraphoma chrysanthemicola TaxID=798071 RepID=A0A8K0R4H9_9PLEO|nr:hypothetical protein FB567DRAFT_446817 [Paraphoma chrysanthemicola]
MLGSTYLIALSHLLPFVLAERTPCTTESDTYIGNAQRRFYITSWIKRGACIRSGGGGDLHCYTTLLGVLEGLVELRKAEYNGASGVLALIPTIGALLGAPTNEVWTLLTILPFGGGLAMALSFGGAIIPVHVEDYEIAMRKGDIVVGSIVSFRTAWGEKGQSPSFDRNLDLLDEKVSARITDEESLRPDKKFIAVGLTGMVLLLIGSQIAMGVVEQGGVLPWWCASRWWMHLWYFMVTLTAITDNLVQLPFRKQHKLYVSRVPYKLTISGGESILTDPLRARSEPDNIGRALKHMETMPAGKVSFSGSTQYTQPRNTVLVMVSISGNTRLASVSRLASKAISIAVFVTGTAMFASVTLVAINMAILVLVLVLSAGGFSRAIAGWLVRRISEKEPMIHVIVNSEEEANQAMCRILKLRLIEDVEGYNDVQVEIDGHIFVNGRRVATRSKWYVAVLGVLANPYDLLLANDNPELTV